MRLNLLHFLPDSHDLMNVHGILGQGVFVDQLLQGLNIQRAIHDLIQFCAYLGPVSVADGLNEQIPEGLVIEGHLSQDVEYLAAEGIAFFLQLFKEALVDGTLAGFLGYKVP